MEITSVRSVRIVADTSEIKLENCQKVFNHQLASRGICTEPTEDADLEICLSMMPEQEKDYYSIMESKGRKIMISSGSCSGILAGIGKFLRNSVFSKGEMIPSSWRGQSVSSSTVRGIQMDTHFNNYYNTAPKQELSWYVEDLALWGINFFEVVFPLIDFSDWTDPAMELILERIGTIYQKARDLDLRVGLEIVPNQDFVHYHKDFVARKNLEPVRRRGNNGHNLCPSIPGALEYLKNTYVHVIRILKKKGIWMDFICFWPYDEGGCSCENCAPWGANGYIKASKAILLEIRKELPGVKAILSTWLFDTPSDEGEWSGLSRKLSEDDFVDYILADSHTDFPWYPIVKGVPGKLPLLNYPEISMWGLFPWGGYGANPLPKRFERLWKQVKNNVSGGIAYSEGIFDDINKCLVSSFYWDKDAGEKDILKEYISWYYDPSVVKSVTCSIEMIEENHRLTAPGNERAITRDSNTQAVTEEICSRAEASRKLLHEASNRLSEEARSGWRWRILLIRTELDCLRFSLSLAKKKELAGDTTWTDVLVGNREAIEWMTELSEIYHSKFDTDTGVHPMYKCVRPALMEIKEEAND